MRALRPSLILFIALTMLFLPSAQSGVTAQVAPYQGFGATTRGGEDGAVVRVTNLNDSGPGSLRDAVTGGHRTVVFDVAGDILLNDHLYVKGAFVTIDGLSAPPPGITLRNRGLIIRGNRGAHDVVVRGIRVRDSAHDGIQIAYGAFNVVIDHISVTGSADGNIDITESSHDVTVSWSLVGGNGKNMLVKYNPSRVSLHHNLFVESLQRSPQIRIDDAGTSASETTADIRNNVIAGWGGGYGTIIWYGPWANLVNNFYSSADDAITVIAARAHVSGNQSAAGAALDSTNTEISPFPAPTVDMQDACTAAGLVLDGVSVRPLDGVDEDYLSRVASPTCRPGPSATPVRPPAMPPSPPTNGSTPVAPAGNTVTLPGGSYTIINPSTGSPAPASAPVSGGSSVNAASITLQLRIATGNDDARERVGGGVATSRDRVAVGARTLFAARFTGVTIPRGSVVLSAVLDLYALDDVTRPVVLRYRGEASGNSTPLRRANSDLSTRAQTVSFVDNRPAGWARDRFNASPDLTSVVQEIVTRSDWVAGNALTLFIDGTASSDNRLIGTFESQGAPSKAATLTIRYRAR